MARRRARVCSAAAAAYTSSSPARGRGQPLQLGVADRRQDDPVVRGPARAARAAAPPRPPTARAGVSRHDQRALPAERLDGARQGGPVRLGDLGWRSAIASSQPARRRRGRRPARSRVRTRRSPATTSTRSPARAASAASSSAASIAESSRGTSSTRPADDAGRVEHQHDPSVALGLPGADHDVAVAGARRASRSSGRRRRGRTRAASRTRCPGRAPAPPTVRPGRAAGPAGDGRCLRDSNGGSDRDRAPATAQGALPGGEAERAAAAAPSRRTPCSSPRRRGRSGVRQHDLVAGAERGAGAGCRWRRPIGCHASRTSSAARRPPGVARRTSRAGRRRAGAHPARRQPLDRERRRRRGEEPGRARPPAPGRPAATATPCRSVRAQHDRHQPQQEQQRDASGDRHRGLGPQRGTGTEPSAEASTAPTSTPSSSASGRSDEPVRERRLGERLDVVGGHEVAAGQPRPGARRAHAARPRRGG